MRHYLINHCVKQMQCHCFLLESCIKIFILKKGFSHNKTPTFDTYIFSKIVITTKNTCFILFDTK